MLTRSITKNETEDFLDILCLVFNLYKDSAKQIFYNDPFFNLSHKLACFENGVMASCLTIIPSGLRIGNANIPVGGIAGVATLPEYRKKGYASELLQYAIGTQCPYLGYYIAALHADDMEFYNKHGFVTSTLSHYCEFSSSDIPEYPESALVREVNKDIPEEYLPMIDLYNKHILAENNGAVRTHERWHIISTILPNRIFVVCSEPQITGYAHLEYSKNSLVIHELIAETPTAIKALLGYLSKQKCDNIQWHASRSQINKFGIDTAAATQCPGAMMCITDLERLLKQSYRENFEPVMKHRSDSLCIVIKGFESYKLIINNLCVFRSDTVSAPYIELDMPAMAQLFTGYRSAAIAYETGIINISGNNALDLADLLFPQRDPFIGSPDQF